MKKLLLTCFIFSFHLVKSQIANYHPVLDSLNRWSYVNNLLVMAPHSAPVPYPYYDGIMYTTTDTVINSISYKKLYSDCFVTSCPYLFGFVREDTATQKIFYSDTTGAPEVMLYDFTMHVGDSINLIRKWQATLRYYTLDTIRNISIQAGVRSKYILTCHSCPFPDTLEWLEGVGCLENFIYPFAFTLSQSSGGPLGACWDYPHWSAQFLSCFEHLQKVYYDSCAYISATQNSCMAVLDTCNYYNTCGVINELTFQSIEIYPNPFHSSAVIELINRGPIDAQLNIYDVLGNKTKRLKISNDKTILDRKNLPNGIYFYTLVSDYRNIVCGKFVVE